MAIKTDKVHHFQVRLTIKTFNKLKRLSKIHERSYVKEISHLINEGYSK